MSLSVLCSKRHLFHSLIPFSLLHMSLSLLMLTVPSFPFSYFLYPRCICPSYDNSAIFFLLLFPLVNSRYICPSYAHSVVFSLLSFPLALNFLSFLYAHSAIFSIPFSVLLVSLSPLCLCYLSPLFFSFPFPIISLLFSIPIDVSPSFFPSLFASVYLTIICLLLPTYLLPLSASVSAPKQVECVCVHHSVIYEEERQLPDTDTIPTTSQRDYLPT
jgi:hypothetical protein